MLAPIIIEGEEQSNQSGVLLRLSISIPRAEVREVLQDVSVPLLVFIRESVSQFYHLSSPETRITTNMFFFPQNFEL